VETPLQKRALGASGFSLAPLALGGNVFDWTADEATSLSIIDAFVERGFSLIDTADVYSTWVEGHKGGESESVIGKWLARGGGRDKIIIATKVGMDMRAAGKGLSKDHIVRSAEASLKRLNTDHIDLYQAHIDDITVPLEETLEAFASLIKAGKVRAIGASNYVAPRLAEALETSAAKGLPRFTVLQPHYNLVNRALFEGDLQKLCIAEGLGVIPYYALAAGFLTGKYRSTADLSGSKRAGTVNHYLDPRGLDILDQLDKIAARYEATPAQIALAWLIAQPGVTAPIVSVTSLKQLDDVLRAADIVLDQRALNRLDCVSA
jgi:aryl-alcohol dehydrogenase-like predicted oxidoreductase